MSIIWCELSPCFRLSTIFCVFWTLSNAVPRTLQTICLQNIISWPLDVLFGSSEFSWIKSQLWFGTPFQHAKWEKVTKYILEKMIQNRARKQQQDRAGEDGRRPGEPILFQVGQRWHLVVVVIVVTLVVVWSTAKEEKSQFFAAPGIVAYRIGSWGWYSLTNWAN